MPTVADFEFRESYASNRDFMRARLTYDLLTLPIRTPLRREVEPKAPLTAVDEALFWKSQSSVTSQSFFKLMLQHKQRNDYAACVRVYTDAEQRGLATVPQLTLALSVCPSLAVAERELLSRPLPGKIDQSFATTLLRLHQRSRSVGFEVFAMLDKAGVKADHIVYTAAIVNCDKLERYDDCWRLYNEMRERNVQPDEVTFTHLIHVCDQRQETERAIGLYEDMMRMDLHPTDVTYAALIRVCARRFDYANEAVLMFERMRGAGYVPTAITYAAVMTALGHNNDREALFALYDQAVAAVGESELLDARLLFACASQFKNGARDRSSEYLERCNAIWQRHGGDQGKASQLISDAFLTLLTKAHFLDRAERLFAALPMTPMRVTAMLQMYHNTKRGDLALALAHKALQQGQLNGAGLAAALGACARCFYAKSGVALWREAAHAGVLADAAGVAPMRALLVTLGRAAEAEELGALTERSARTVERRFFPHERGTAARVRRMNRPMPPPVTE